MIALCATRPTIHVTTDVVVHAPCVAVPSVVGRKCPVFAICTTRPYHRVSYLCCPHASKCDNSIHDLFVQHNIICLLVQVPHIIFFMIVEKLASAQHPQCYPKLRSRWLQALSSVYCSPDTRVTPGLDSCFGCPSFFSSFFVFLLSVCLSVCTLYHHSGSCSGRGHTSAAPTSPVRPL